MKKILAVVIMLLSVCYAEELKSVLGIPFGTEAEDAYNILVSKGYEINWDRSFGGTDENGNTDVSFLYTGKSGVYFAGKEVEMVQIFAYNDLVYQIRITFTDNDDIDKIRESYMKKYELNVPELYFHCEGSILDVSDDNYKIPKKKKSISQEEIDADI